MTATMKPCRCTERHRERVRDALLNRVTIHLRSVESLYRDVLEATPADFPRLENELQALSGRALTA